MEEKTLYRLIIPLLLALVIALVLLISYCLVVVVIEHRLQKKCHDKYHNIIQCNFSQPSCENIFGRYECHMSFLPLYHYHPIYKNVWIMPAWPYLLCSNIFSTFDCCVKWPPPSPLIQGDSAPIIVDCYNLNPAGKVVAANSKTCEGAVLLTNIYSWIMYPLGAIILLFVTACFFSVIK